MKTKINFICNDSEIETSIHPGTTLLDFIRKQLHLTGTKEGCREGDCGACTVLIGELIENSVRYQSANSCLFPVGDINGKHVVTIEGLNSNELNTIQKQFIEKGASQCGFCTPGFIISLTAYLLSNSKYDSAEAVESLSGNICRCTGHSSIINAARSVLKYVIKNITQDEVHIKELIHAGIIPNYFLTIEDRLKKLRKSESIENKNNYSVLNISGGTDLFVQKWDEILNQDINLIFSHNLPDHITEKNGKVVIGARTSISDFIDSTLIQKYFPTLKNKLKLFGSLPIRNRATIGGNIVNASPIADMVNILLALNSTLEIKTDSSERIILLKDFYKGYKQVDLNTGELIHSISFDIPQGKYFFNFEKVSKRTYLDIASVNSSIYLSVQEDVISKIYLSAGGVAPIPLSLIKTSEFLTGKSINSKNISNAYNVALSEINPISDARGTKEYKVLLLRQLIFAHFISLFPDKISVREIA